MATKINRPTARAIVVHDGKVLLMERERTDAKTGERLRYYSIPGGEIEDGETPEQTVEREVAEETSVRIKVIRKLSKVTAPDGKQHTFYVADYVSGKPHLRPDSPEAGHTDQVYNPRWVDHQEYAKVQDMIYPSYQSVRGIIELLLRQNEEVPEITEYIGKHAPKKIRTSK